MMTSHAKDKNMSTALSTQEMLLVMMIRHDLDLIKKGLAFSDACSASSVAGLVALAEMHKGPSSYSLPLPVTCESPPYFDPFEKAMGVEHWFLDEKLNAAIRANDLSDLSDLAKGIRDYAKLPAEGLHTKTSSRLSPPPFNRDELMILLKAGASDALTSEFQRIGKEDLERSYFDAGSLVHSSARYHDATAIGALHAAGVDFSKRNGQAKTALDEALDYQKYDSASYLMTIGMVPTLPLEHYLLERIDHASYVVDDYHYGHRGFTAQEKVDYKSAQSQSFQKMKRDIDALIELGANPDIEFYNMSRPGGKTQSAREYLEQVKSTVRLPRSKKPDPHAPVFLDLLPPIPVPRRRPSI